MEYVLDLAAYGNVFPPKDMRPSLTTKLFAIAPFLFHYLFAARVNYYNILAPIFIVQVPAEMFAVSVRVLETMATEKDRSAVEPPRS